MYYSSIAASVAAGVPMSQYEPVERPQSDIDWERKAESFPVAYHAPPPPDPVSPSSVPVRISAQDLVGKFIF